MSQYKSVFKLGTKHYKSCNISFHRFMGNSTNVSLLFEHHRAIVSRTDFNSLYYHIGMWLIWSLVIILFAILVQMTSHHNIL